MLDSWESDQCPLCESYSNLYFHMEKIQCRVRGRWKTTKNFELHLTWSFQVRIIESNKGQIPKFRFLSPGACGQPQSPYCLTSAGGNVQQSQTVPLASKYLRWLLKRGVRRWEGSIIIKYSNYSNYLKPTKNQIA